MTSFLPAVKGIEESQENFDGVSVRIYKPAKADKQLPGILFAHGGGGCMFSIKVYSYFTRQLSKKANAVIVSVEYRLAPENKFPAAFDDVYTATKYFLKNASKYNVIPEKIGIAGDSAGGNLAMAVALKLAQEKENGLPSLAFEVLIYPCLQAFDFNLASYRENNTGRNTHCAVTRNTMIFFHNLYAFGNYKNFTTFANNKHITPEIKKKYRDRVDPSLLQGRYRIQPNDDENADNIELASQIAEIILNPYFSPLMVSNELLGKLPHTYLLTCEYDPLRDEGLILNERMNKIRHPIEHFHLPGSEHGFLLFPYYSEYNKSLDNIALFVQKVTS